LLRVVLDESTEDAVAALDWGLHSGLIDIIDLETLALALPSTKRGVVRLVDARCESLPESLARTRLAQAGHRVESQVPLGLGAIDLVVDGVVALEVDGEEFHLTRFEADRRKDIAITRVGHHAIRASAMMVFGSWGDVHDAILLAIAARRHPPLSETQDSAHRYRAGAPPGPAFPRQSVPARLRSPLKS
jgi:very-short-patch-repair endonuclease